MSEQPHEHAGPAKRPREDDGERMEPAKRPRAGRLERLGADDCLDQFYTQASCVDVFMARAVEAVGPANIAAYWDPSAGDGYAGRAVARLVPGLQVVQSDVEPTGPDVEQRDALAGGPPPALPSAGVLGGFNPPYGRSSALAIQFVEMMAPHCEFIVMLVPASVTLTLERFYRKLLLIPVDRSKPAFYRARTGEDFSYAAVVFVGARRAEPLPNEAYVSPHVQVRISPGALDLTDPSYVMIARRVGGTTGRQVLIRSVPDRWRLVTLDARGRLSIGEPTDNFAGLKVVEHTNFYVLQTTPTAPAVDWQRVAEFYVRLELPDYVTHADHRSMRADDIARRTDAAIRLALAE